MFFASLGLLYGADSTIGRLWYNQSAAVLGNLIGGAIFIGLMEHLLNHWSSPLFRSHHPHAGTLLGHDVESTRFARDDHHYHQRHPRHDGPEKPEVDDEARKASQDRRETGTERVQEELGGGDDSRRDEPAQAPAERHAEGRRAPIWQLLGRSRSQHGVKEAADQV